MKKNSKNLIHYDRNNDILYLGARKGVEEEFIEVSPGVNVELDANGRVIGVEIFDASKIFKSLLKPSKKRVWVGI